MTEKSPGALIDLELPKADGLLSKAARYVRQRWKRLTAIAAIVAGALAVGGHMLGGIAGLWEFYRVYTSHDAGSTVAASSTAASAHAVPQRVFRSIAVLPFASSGSSEDEDTAQMLSRNLTQAIRRAYPDMFVVSTSSVQPFKGAARNARKIGEELKVRYIVEGALGRAAAGSELTVELIDSTDGAQLWSDRMAIAASRDVAESLSRIRAGIRDAVVNATKKEILSLPEKERSAWDLVLRAYDEDQSIEGFKRRKKLFEEALRVDPNFVQALRSLAHALFQRIQDDPDEYPALIRQLDDVSSRAVRAAPDDLRVWLTRAGALRFQGNMGGALAANEAALRIDPLDSQAVMQRAALYIYLGRPAESLPVLSRAMELDPTVLTSTNALVWRCLAYFNMSKDKDAAPICEEAAGLWDRWIMYAFLTSIHAHLGNDDKMRFWKAKLLQANPRASLKRVGDMGRINSNNPEFNIQVDRLVAGLRKAGIAEN